jgi:diaminopropionate ammonia-lyase
VERGRVSELDLLVNARTRQVDGSPFGHDPVAGLDYEPITFHRRLPGYEPTPLVDAPSLASRLGVGKVLVKDESSRFGLPAFKILGASWAIYCALTERAGTSLEPWGDLAELADRLGDPGSLSLSAATDGNHGRAVARFASMLGLGARIYVPAGTAAARIEAIESEDARCTVVDGTYDDAVRRSAEDAGPDCLVISDTSWPGYTAVPAWVIDGYSTVFAEIDAQLARAGLSAPDVVAVPIGVGSLAAAAVRHLNLPGRSEPWPRIVGVEPVHAACVLESVRAGHLVTLDGPQDSIMAGLNCGTPSEIAFPVIAAGIDLFVAIEDGPVRQAMRDLAAAGIVSGETGAAALAGLSELLAPLEAPTVRDLDGERARHLRDVARGLGLGPDSTVLLLSTEGATDPAAYREIVCADPPHAGDFHAATDGGER